MKKYLHRVFNPHLTTTEAIIRNLKDDSFKFDSIIFVNPYECVAVFVKFVKEVLDISNQPPNPNPSFNPPEIN